MKQIRMENESRPDGGFVLGTARRLYLIAAIISLLVVAGGIGIAIYFQMGAWQEVREAPMPSEYTPSPLTLSAKNIEPLLVPPQNIRFVVFIDSISAPLSERSNLGVFTADTPNELASYPSDFDILGGKDAAFFDRVRSEGKRSGLKPTRKLINKINALLPTLGNPQTIAYELRIIARDRYGTVSKPETVSFSLTYAPPQINSETSASYPAESANKLTELQRLAKDIALLVDPNKTPDYFDAYRRAQTIPDKCGASANDTRFIMNFRKMFDRLRSKLTATNVSAFYDGMCSDWQRTIAEQQMAQEKARDIRASVIARNRSAKEAADTKKMVAVTERTIALTVAGSALGAFLLISLFLAFLAIENHTRAIRRSVEKITQTPAAQEDGGVESGASS